MAAELERLKKYYEELAKTNPSMESMVRQLGNTINLNDSLGGPKGISVDTSKDQERKRQIRLSVVQFFIENPLSQKNERRETMQKFNREIGCYLPEDIKINDLFIPTTYRSTGDMGVRNLARQMDKTTKGWLNRLVTGIYRHGKKLGHESITIGQFMKLDESVKIYNVGTDSLELMRVAFERPEGN